MALPRVINKPVLPVDVDETLLMHDVSRWGDNIDTITMQDPFDAKTTIHLAVNRPMIKILKDEKAKGTFIIVWSRQGEAWAWAAVVALKLEKYVDMVSRKPNTYLDDKPSNKWMTDRVYVEPDVKYKEAYKPTITKEK